MAEPSGRADIFEWRLGEIAVSDFKDFLLWEHSTRDVLDFKKAYVDMAGDALAGLVLSEIVYWHLPNKKEQSKLRIFKDEKYWIAVRRYEWWDRTRLSPRQADRAIAILREQVLIETDVFKFYGEPTMHIHLLESSFMARWDEVMNNPPVNPFSPIREKDIDETGKTLSPIQANPLTETTPKTTTDKTPPASRKFGTPEWDALHGVTPDPEAAHKIEFEKTVCEAFESAFGIKRPWVWYPVNNGEAKVWKDFREFLVELYSADPDCFTKYVTWSGQDYSRGVMSAISIKRNPQDFPTAWAAFCMGTKYNAKSKPQESEYKFS